ncbi:MAG: hypothetical protein WC476_06730 [Phycisphaerae bacterium]
MAKIAEDGHVYGFVPDANVFRTRGSKEDVLRVRKIGITNASTFNGFCAIHDNEIFRVLEQGDFNCSGEHAFLLGYRALCRILFAKKVVLDRENLYRNMDRGQPFFSQVPIQRFVDDFFYGKKLAHDELSQIKKGYDEILKAKDYSKVKYYAVMFDCHPDILCSEGFWPEFDFNGQQVQDALNPKADYPDLLLFSIITTEKGGAAVFTWLEKGGACEKFLSSLHALPDSKLPEAIVRLVFEYFENMYFKISWWENLSMDIRKKLHNRMAQNVMIHNADCLIDDGLRTVNWRVNSRKTNFSTKREVYAR